MDAGTAFLNDRGEGAAASRWFGGNDDSNQLFGLMMPQME